MALPTLNEIHRVAFSPARYGKQPSADGAATHNGDSSGSRRRVIEDNDEENGHEVYGYSKHAQCSVPEEIDGSLERMTRMPVDILYEIFSHLHPKDVLNLSRATRSLHTILSEAHARSVWRTSLASVRALPSCPPDMTEIQYASLAFDDWCHFCLSSGIQDIAWVCRVRCCQKCLKEQFISEDELDLWLPEDIYIEKPDSIFPYFLSQKRAAGRNKPMYYLSSARKYLRQLDFLAGDAAIAAWSQEKKENLARRVEHAARSEYWHMHWAFRPSFQPATSYMWELALVIWLSVLLVGLWKDKVMELAARF